MRQRRQDLPRTHHVGHLSDMVATPWSTSWPMQLVPREPCHCRSWVREKLIMAGVTEVFAAGTATFPRDHLFRSPSSAASALLGRTANGWREWKNAQGRTLSQVKRA